jgi:hypothetical protein
MNSDSLRMALARIAAEHGAVPVRYVEDVGLPADDGHYVTLTLLAGGKAAEVLVLTTENFYACLGKVMSATLPSMGHLPTS